MTLKEIRALAKKHGGWIERGNVIRFPSPHQADEYMKEAARIDTERFLGSCAIIDGATGKRVA